jgi:hypothetical protein
MTKKGWTIQYINDEHYKLRDKIDTSPVYLTAKEAIKAMHEEINGMMGEEDSFNHAEVGNITEEFLESKEPGYYVVIYTDNCTVHYVLACKAIV